MHTDALRVPSEALAQEGRRMQHCLCAAIQEVSLGSCTCMSHECTKRLNLQDKSGRSSVR